MAKGAYFNGGAAKIGSSRTSRKAQQKAVEDGIKDIVAAVKDLMHKPRAEREAHLEILSAQLELIGAKLEQLDPRSGRQRVLATRKIISIVKRASDARP